MVLLKGPVRVGRLLERERAGDMNLEGTSLDESIELVDDLAVRLNLVVIRDASLDSLVNGTQTEAIWTKITIGPAGKAPRDWGTP